MTDHVDVILEQWRRERPDLDTSVMGVIGRISRICAHITSIQRDVFASHGLDGGAFDLLATLRRSPPPHQLTPQQLTLAAMITTGATAQRLNRLEGEGLITRQPNPTDARGVLVTLTRRGTRLVDETLPDHLHAERQVLAGLSPAQSAQLAALLRLLLASLEGNQAARLTTNGPA